MQEIFNIGLGALIGFIFSLFLYIYKQNNELSINLKRERLTKLLFPLYQNLKQLDGKWEASFVNDKTSPEDYLDYLPLSLLELKSIICNYVFLADSKFIKASLDFLKWQEVSSVDSNRFEKIMTNKLSEVDKPLSIYKKIVFKTFEKEHQEFLNYYKPFFKANIFPNFIRNFFNIKDK